MDLSTSNLSFLIPISLVSGLILFPLLKYMVKKTSDEVNKKN